jgi:hypothetical protein
VAPGDLGAALAAARSGLRIDAHPGDPASVTIGGAAPDPRLVLTVTAWAAERDVLVAELRTAGGSLEDRYLELTGDRDVEHST